MDNRPVGIFDSGIGGLTVVSEVVKNLPNESIVYVGDTIRAPYGDKTKEQLLEYSKQIINFLISRNCKAVVIACNTVSSNCLDELKSLFDIDLIDVVKPSVDEATNSAKDSVCVLATKATVKSKIHEKLIKNIRPELDVYVKACPLFVPIVEEGFLYNDMAFMAANEYLASFKDKSIDTYILGCTHYPFILDSIKKVIGHDKNIIDPAYRTAICLKDIMTNKGILSDASLTQYKVFFTGENDNFISMVNLTFSNKSVSINQIKLT